MFEISIDGKKVAGEVTFETAILYEQQFGSEMLSDLLGKQTSGANGVTTIDDDGSMTIDFTIVPWNAVLKTLWAAIKTKDPKTPGFDKWVKGLRGMNAFEARGALTLEVDDCFFRLDPEEAQEGEPAE